MMHSRIFIFTKVPAVRKILFLMVAGWLYLAGMPGQSSLMAQELRTATYPDGRIRYQGYFQNGKPVGELTRYYPDGKIQARMNHRGDTVESVLYSRDGTYTSSGLYRGQKKTGTWSYRKGEQLLLTEDYREGLLEGWTTGYFASGEPAERRQWKGGVQEGGWELYYKNGKLRLQAHFAGGKLDGAFRAYTFEGSLRASGNYRKDLKEGEWLYYGEEGKEVRKVVYQAGIPEHVEQRIAEESRKMDELVEQGRKIPDPALFADEPEVYMKITGME